MSSKNKISASLSPEQIQLSKDLITNFKNNLNEVLQINLTSDERRSMLKMGDKTLAFVEKALEYASQNPNLVPVYLDLQEANIDYQLSKSLYDIFQQLNTLITSVEDTIMIAGSEAYEAALVFYHSVKGASRSDASGSMAIYNDLSKRFPNKRKATVTPIEK